jgi:hypothetical protein
VIEGLRGDESIALAIILGIVEWFHDQYGTITLGTAFNVDTNIPAGMPIGEMEMPDSRSITFGHN